MKVFMVTHEFDPKSGRYKDYDSRTGYAYDGSGYNYQAHRPNQDQTNEIGNAFTAFFILMMVACLLFAIWMILWAGGMAFGYSGAFIAEFFCSMANVVQEQLWLTAFAVLGTIAAGLVVWKSRNRWSSYAAIGAVCALVITSTLYNMWHPSPAYLVKRLGNRWVFTHAKWELSEKGKEAIPALTAILKNQNADSSIKQDALEILSRIDSAAAAAFPEMQKPQKVREAPAHEPSKPSFANAQVKAESSHPFVSEEMGSLRTFPDGHIPVAQDAPPGIEPATVPNLLYVVKNKQASHYRRLKAAKIIAMNAPHARRSTAQIVEVLISNYDELTLPPTGPVTSDDEEPLRYLIKCIGDIGPEASAALPALRQIEKHQQELQARAPAESRWFFSSNGD